MARVSAGEYPVRWWVPGDWNAFFGLFTNVALNVIVLSGLVLGVVKLPDDIVFGRILPALGIALPPNDPLLINWTQNTLAELEDSGTVLDTMSNWFEDDSWVEQLR